MIGIWIICVMGAISAQYPWYGDDWNDEVYEYNEGKSNHILQYTRSSGDSHFQGRMGVQTQNHRRVT